MSGDPVGQKAVGLAWLPPSANALLALTSAPPNMRAIAHDPAALAHVLRFVRPTADPDRFELTSAVLTQPSLCSNAATLLERTGPLRKPSAGPDRIDVTAWTAATVAGELARRYDCCSASAIHAAASLSPLGWYAVRAVDPSAMSDFLHDPSQLNHLDAEQRRRWGLSASAIAHRLAARWRLPPWLTVTIGFLRLDVRDAVAAGAPEQLFRIVQAAVAAAEHVLGWLGLTDSRVIDSRDPVTNDALILAEAASRTPPQPDDVQEAPAWLMARLLRATADARRTNGSVWLSESETCVDRLVDALSDLRADFQTRVRDARLEGLAEFAAGASHEINNPLAVVRGHAQLLLAQEADPDRRRQLETIVRQTRRVHDLLHGTLQFARPPRPSPAPTPLSQWIAATVALHAEDARERGVLLTSESCNGIEEWGRFDQAQARQALDHLIRNSVEAAQAGGWVRVSVQRQGSVLAVSVEDSGPGPSDADLDHLFDPFFSGREAGRGRGLGLAIAWRLARINGGDVRYDPPPGGPSRFVLSLPAISDITERLSA